MASAEIGNSINPRGEIDEFTHLVQANLGKASRYSAGKPRDWSLYFFFKIVSDEQDERLSESVEENLRFRLEPGVVDPYLHSNAILDELASSSMCAVDDDSTSRAEDDDFPKLLRFRTWLGNVLRNLEVPIGGVSSPLALLAETALDASLKKEGVTLLTPAEVVDILLENFDDPENFEKELLKILEALLEVQSKDPLQFLSFLAKVSDEIYKVLKDPKRAEEVLSKIAGDQGPEAAALRVFAGGLPTICIYELLRQVAGQAIRSEAVADKSKNPTFDPVPVNLAFTASGLKELGIHHNTLASFPEAFREGMAARAERLGDVGASSPENWESVLGQPFVHGYFTGGFQIPVLPKEHIDRLREGVEAFNNLTFVGRFLRLLVNTLFRAVGLEILHIELGEDPHIEGELGAGPSGGLRREHFGFVDGISQPFKNMKLDPAPAGGGTPKPQDQWADVARGEIYLGLRDEDGDPHLQPSEPSLRDGGTFMVFRKLEQDVAGFRQYLESQRPKDQQAQEKLAAQFVGRWRDGTALVLSPDTQGGPNPTDNDFRYLPGDVDGNACPSGSHIRRSNPRDIGAGEVRRHRILRRSMSYGGPFLPEGSADDGRKRGLLFFAANSRIELQFEVIQADWINGGEFLGQAGLSKCPLIGANKGGIEDQFFEPTTGVPIYGIPRFVTTRGGEYFFVPSVTALRKIASGETFEMKPADLPYGGYAMGDVDVPDPFDKRRIGHYAQRMLKGTNTAIRLKLPSPAADKFGSDLVYVAKHCDVTEIMRGAQNGSEVFFSTESYRHASAHILGGDPMLIGTDPGAATGKLRERLHCILGKGWAALDASIGARDVLAKIVQDTVEEELKKAEPAGRINIVHDLATRSSYHVLRDLYGVPGPDKVSDIALAIPFRSIEADELPDGWINQLLETVPAGDEGLVSLQTWSLLMIKSLIGNVNADQRMLKFAKAAADEMIAYLRALWDGTKLKKDAKPQTFVQAFKFIERDIIEIYGKDGYTADDYKQDVLTLLAELVGTPIAVVPATFNSVMTLALRHGVDLAALAPFLSREPILEPDPLRGTWGDLAGFIRFVYEAERLNSNFPIMFRRSNFDFDLRGFPIKKDDWLISIVQAANVDELANREAPKTFSLHPYLTGKKRPLKTYLLFGIPCGEHECWGRDRIALGILGECLKGASRLNGLRGVAATSKHDKIPVGLAIDLKANFNELL